MNKIEYYITNIIFEYADFYSRIKLSLLNKACYDYIEDLDFHKKDCIDALYPRSFKKINMNEPTELMLNTKYMHIFKTKKKIFSFIKLMSFIGNVCINGSFEDAYEMLKKYNFNDTVYTIIKSDKFFVVNDIYYYVSDMSYCQPFLADIPQIRYILLKLESSQNTISNKLVQQIIIRNKDSDIEVNNIFDINNYRDFACILLQTCFSGYNLSEEQDIERSKKILGLLVARRSRKMSTPKVFVHLSKTDFITGTYNNIRIELVEYLFILNKIEKIKLLIPYISNFIYLISLRNRNYSFILEYSKLLNKYVNKITRNTLKDYDRLYFQTKEISDKLKLIDLSLYIYNNPGRIGRNIILKFIYKIMIECIHNNEIYDKLVRICKPILNNILDMYIENKIMPSMTLSFDTINKFQILFSAEYYFLRFFRELIVEDRNDHLTIVKNALIELSISNHEDNMKSKILTNNDNTIIFPEGEFEITESFMIKNSLSFICDNRISISKTINNDFLEENYYRYTKTQLTREKFYKLHINGYLSDIHANNLIVILNGIKINKHIFSPLISNSDFEEILDAGKKRTKSKSQSMQKKSLE